MKLSNILAFMTIIQFIYALAVAKGWYTSPYTLSYEHEDLVFVLYFMTWFIVRAIENIGVFPWKR
mgnify:CR=1 FL=1